ncbi:MAG: FTR1 family protein [Candidatus Heimdallarchaeota archaeon]|nr:FTR1 family protein [Candidatus Heimdallarchaeota archaeon]
MFSVVSFLITLRETIEAALIIGILLIYVIKIDKRKLSRDIWIGTIVGILVSIGAAFAFNYLLGGFDQYEKYIEGFSMVIVAILLTWMIVWMQQTSKNIKSKLESRINQSIKNEQRFGLMFLAFITVLREGIETVLFLTGIEATGEEGVTILLSGLVGILVALIIAIIIFFNGRSINIKLFFNITSILLVLFAAGMLAYGFHEFQELHWFGTEDSWLNSIVWDTSAFLNDKTNEFGKFLRALFGYQDKPTLIELIVYFGYYLLLAVIFVIVKKISKNKKEPMIKTEKRVENV